MKKVKCKSVVDNNKKIVTVIIVLSCFTKLCYSQSFSNLTFDVNFPIIITDKTSAEESHFGASVGLTVGKDDKAADGFGNYKTATGWVFVGAPKADYNLDDGYTKGSAPGVTWRCSLGRISKDQLVTDDICEVLKLDHNKTGGAKIDGKPYLESKNKNFLGITLSVGTKRLVTCAPKWVRGNYFMNGLCYWLPIDDQPSFAREKIEGIIPADPYRLIPFFLTGDKFKQYQHYSIGKETFDDWAYGQAGISAHVTSEKRGTALGEYQQLLLGAPGVRMHSGAMVVYTDNSQPPRGRERLNRNNSEVYSEYVVFHRGEVGSESRLVSSHSYDYFGYAVTSVRININNKEKKYYVGGSPRGNSMSGEVIVFDYPSSVSLRMQIKKNNIISTMQPEEGHFGSYFGSVLHSEDIIAGDDNSQEIFVGAPLHETAKNLRKRRLADNPTESSGDHGAVYVYQFKAQKNIFEKVGGILTGNNVAGARFGSAISSISVVNSGASVKQLVVGAPYENYESSGQSSYGVIYIYQAHGDRMTLKQRIDPSTWSHNLNLGGFGCSFSAGVDIDNNETPDLAVGSYKSKQVVVFRSRPLIELRGRIEFPNIPKAIIYKSTKAVNITSCVTFKGQIGSVDDALQIGIVLTIDQDYQRLKFESPDVDKYVPYRLSYIANVMHMLDACKTFTAKFLPHNDHTWDDSRSSIKIVQELKYTLPGPSAQFNPLHYAITYQSLKGVDKEAPFLTSKFDDFKSTLPFTTEHKTESGLTISPNCREIICKPIFNYKIRWLQSLKKGTEELYSEKNKKRFVAGSNNDLIFEVEVTNTGEAAVDPIFFIVFPSYAKLRPILRDNRTDANCLRQPKDPQATRHTGNCTYSSMMENTTWTFTSKFDVRNFNPLEPHKNDGDKFFVIFSMFQKSEKGQKSETHEIEFEVDTEITIIGSVDETSTLKNPLKYNSTGLAFSKHNTIETLELYSAVRQKFEILLDGVTPVKKILMNFEIPLQLANSSDQIIQVLRPKPLYLTSSKESYHVECTTNQKFKFFEITREPVTGFPDTDESQFFGSQQQAKERRKKRSTMLPLATPEAITTVSKTKTQKIQERSEMFYFNCHNGKFDCMKVECIAEMNPGEYGSIPKNKDNSFFMSFDLYLVKSYIDKITKDKPLILIESKGTAHIYNNNSVSHFNDADVSQTLLGKRIAIVAPWIWITATIVALVVLALICLALYKCGFFKRETREKLNEAKADERRKSMMVPRGSRASHSDFGESQEGLLNDENVAASVQKENVAPDTPEK